MKLIATLLLSIFTTGLTGCAHHITINPSNDPTLSSAPLIKKNVAYVLTDADRQKEVTTEGGGGDKVKYFPYRDLEKTLRDVLRSIYDGVYVVTSPSDKESLNKYKAAFIFTPEISTSSSSPSSFTWPPTKFSIEAILNVTDGNGNLLARSKAIGSGQAEYDEFKSNFGLAGQRAATDLAKKLEAEIRANPKLK